MQSNEDAHGLNRKSDGEPRRFTRKAFLVALGTGAAVAISGHFLSRRENSGPTSGAASGPSSKYPKLKPGLRTDREGEFLKLVRQDGKDPVICLVNYPGRVAVGLMDGRHTTEDIAHAMADQFGLEKTEALNAKMAIFIAELGMMGFLEQPYYSYVFYEETPA